MRLIPLCLLAALPLASCAVLQAQTPAPPLKVWRSLGSLQCSGGGTPVAALREQLTAAGVVVLASACGSDGRMRAAMCGRPDGRIAVFDIAAGDAARAAAAGFQPLSALPEAVLQACP